MTEVSGRPVSPTRSERLATLRNFTSPVESLTRLEGFAKWLFATTATVGALGAAFSTAGFLEPQRLGKWLFGLSIASLGLSLGLAAYTLSPKWVVGNRNSIGSLEDAIAVGFAKRRGPLRAAGLAFTLSLVLAGLAPLSSDLNAPWEPMPGTPSLAVSVDQSGALKAEVEAQGLERFTDLTATISIEEEPSQSLAEVAAERLTPEESTKDPDASPKLGEQVGTTIPVATATADRDGHASVVLDMSSVAEIASAVSIVATYTPRGSNLREQELSTIQIVPRPTLQAASGPVGKFKVVLLGQKKRKRSVLLVNAVSHAVSGQWIEFTSVDHTGTRIQVLRIRSSNVDRIRRVGGST